MVFQRYQDIDLSLRNYIFSLGAYRALYICNWIYRATFERVYQHHWIAQGCGILQVAFYVDFAYFYYRHKTQPDYQMLTYRLLSRFCQDDDERNNNNGNDSVPLTSDDAIEESTESEQALLENTYQLLSDEQPTKAVVVPKNDHERAFTTPTNNEEDGLLVVV